MCGLGGIARIGGAGLGADAEVLLRAIATRLEHRGPDGTTIEVAGEVGLAFTRLSIVDAVGGGQPLTSEDGSILLIANGEIYNHHELEAGLPGRPRMRTDSDCEVLVHLYREHGHRFLDHVRGIYAIVIWDRSRRRLVFARDRFGIKPLYFARTPGKVTFASEIKAILADPDVPHELDWHACLHDQMMTGAPFLDDAPPVTWFRGIESVPAATVVGVDVASGRVERHRYWTLPTAASETEVSDAELVGGYRDALRASVEESGMSDAEIGLFLSGGIDSAAVGAFSRSLPELHTFTALNGGTFANDDAERAHRTARFLERPNHQVLFEADRVPGGDEWKRLLWLLETPLCGPEQFYKYELHRFAKALRPNIKVMLLGQGSDEFNGGYSVELGGEESWESFTARVGAMARDRALLEQPRLSAWWDQQFALLTDDAVGRRNGGDAFDPYLDYIVSRYRQIEQYNCWHEDRTAAGNGIEARVPFLDQRIVEVTASVPPSKRARLLWDKQMLRAALDGVLPADVVARPKAMFFYGAGVRHVYRTFAQMLAQDDYALLEEALSTPAADGVVDAGNARAMAEHLLEHPAAGQIEYLLRIVNVCLLDAAVRNPPPPPVEWAQEQVPVELEVGDWGAGTGETVRRAIFGSSEPSLRDVPRLKDNVLLVGEVDRSTWYLAVDGQIQYVISATEDAGWLDFLRSIDGRRDLAAVLDSSGASLPEVEPLLHEAVDVGVLELTRA